MIALDTETTGRDLYHGAKPFFITTCTDGGVIRYWEWHVDPLTREPEIPEGELEEVAEYVTVADRLVLQNSKFDAAALDTIGVGPAAGFFDWSKVDDTLIAGHLLASSQPHNLTDMVLQYVGHDIEPLEVTLGEACREARRLARRQFPDWLVAAEGLPTMPSVRKAGANKKDEKDKTWKSDMWLPRAVARELGYPPGHPWWTVLSDYSNTDSESTVLLWQVQEDLIRRRDLWEIYRERLRVLPVAYGMERHGITINRRRLRNLRAEYRVESDRAGKVCMDLAGRRGYDLQLPRGSVNGSVTRYVFDVLRLPVVAYTDTGNPSLGKEAVETWLATIDEGTPGHEFVRNLGAKRQRDTALTYLEGYERFWIPLGIRNSRGEQLWYRLNPSLNPTGTDTLRWSSSNPNEQNISKKEGFNLRHCFGPAPGREWWSLDAKNIELRLPAYAAGEEDMIRLFERPDDPPYFGSNHLLVSHVLHQERFEACRDDQGQVDGRIFKKRYESTWYKWVKNGNFAVQYGAVESSGTADRAYHVKGAQRVIQQRFKKIKALSDRCVTLANTLGYVETMPDKTVNPRRGYPLLMQRNEWSRVEPTKPLSYFIQGTAMWWMGKAMVRCQDRLDDWAREGFDAHLVMQVHDEMVFDFPKAAHPKADPGRSNLGRIAELQELMEMGGDDIGIPTPVGVEYNEVTWSEGVTM